MAKKIDSRIINLSQLYGTNKTNSILMFKRFFDDIFSIFKGTTKDLQKVVEPTAQIHKIHYEP